MSFSIPGIGRPNGSLSPLLRPIQHITFLPRTRVVVHPVQKSGTMDQTFRISKAQYNTILGIITKIVDGEDERHSNGGKWLGGRRGRVGGS